MRARDLVIEYPTVRLRDDALSAARIFIDRHLPGLIVLDEEDHPVTILPASQVLLMIIPRYIQDDPRLAGVVDESHADKVCAALEGKTVADMLPRNRPALPTVNDDDTTLEIAAIMAQARSPLVAVMEGSSLIGVVTAPRMLERLLPA